jgi:hypothetical protein
LVDFPGFAAVEPPAYSPVVNRFRPLLTAVLGLMLCVQGMAIAAAPVELPADPASSMEMPCHGDVSTDVAACDCCDGDCPDMAGCAIGHFAGVPALALSFIAPSQGASASATWAPKTAAPPFPLRPPIGFHA